MNDQKMTRTLNEFVITNCTAEAMEDKILLTINMKRISGPFWTSLFIPSICLLLAAEIALFIDESHFQAMIMVSLTSNLVMYTLYDGVKDKMPEDSSFKLLDIWLLHGLIMPMIVFVVLAANEMINAARKETGKNCAKVEISAVAASVKNPGISFPSSKGRKACIYICKAIIPIVSAIFISGFFFICLHN